MTSRLLLGAALALSVAACSRNETVVRRDDGPVTVDVRHAGGPLTGRDPDAGVPIYDLSATLTDQNGDKVSLDTYRGHPVMIAMFYATCPHACPTLIAAIDKIDRSLDATTRARTRVLLVSFDPGRDTPAQLHDVADRHQLDLARWKLASVSDTKARELAALLGVKYRKTPDGGYAHSSVITVLDGQGRIAARIDGLAQPTDALVDALRDAASVPVR